MKQSWQDKIPEERLALFEKVFRDFFDESIGWDSLFHISEYTRYLDRGLTPAALRHLYARDTRKKFVLRTQIGRKKKEQARNRNRNDYLTKLIPEWVATQCEREVTATVSGSRRHRGVDLGRYFVPLKITLDSVKRMELTSSFLNVLCLIRWKRTLSELVELARMGDDRSVFCLVETSKRFLTSVWMKDRIVQAERFHDYAFFRKLGRAVQTDARAEYREDADIGFAVLLLWHLGFKDLPYRELLDYLNRRFNYPSRNIESFRVFVNRLGLRKSRKT